MSGPQVLQLEVGSSENLVPTVEKRSLKVLTITPFYPSADDPTQGRFISEPLEHIRDLGIVNRTIAVRPVYRKRPIPAHGLSAHWKRYVSIPTNMGLPTAGSFLARTLVRSVAEGHRTEPYDLIHAHAALPCGHAAMKLSKYLSIPFVVTVHGLDVFFTRQARGFAGRCSKHVVEEVYRSAAAVICISEKVREQVLASVHANTAVIYNGVDTAVFRPPNAKSSSTMVLSVGNLIRTKGHDVLLRAFAEVSGSAPGCTLEIIGDGPELANLTRLASRLEIADKVSFSGRRPRSYVADAMSRCSVFALPSVYEGLGCVYLEAMACGKPVIGCRGQGIEEIIQHGVTGMLIAPGDTSQLIKVSQKLLGDCELSQRIGEGARDIIKQRFTAQHQAQQLAGLYQRYVQ